MGMEKFIQNKLLISGELDDFQVMMHLERGKYFGLNPVGKRIWELIEVPKNVDELTQLLMEEYQVSESQCRQEVEEFLGKAFQREIIVKYEPVQ